MQYNLRKSAAQAHPPPKKTRLPKLLIALIIGLLVIQVVVSNRLATSGLKIVQMETDIGRLNQENGDIRQEIASASALLTITEKAKALGFIKKAQPLFISVIQPVALNIQ